MNDSLQRIKVSSVKNVKLHSQEIMKSAQIPYNKLSISLCCNEEAQTLEFNRVCRNELILHNVKLCSILFKDPKTRHPPSHLAKEKENNTQIVTHTNNKILSSSRMIIYSTEVSLREEEEEEGSSKLVVHTCRNEIIFSMHLWMLRMM